MDIWGGVSIFGEVPIHMNNNTIAINDNEFFALCKFPKELTEHVFLKGRGYPVSQLDVGYFFLLTTKEKP